MAYKDVAALTGQNFNYAAFQTAHQRDLPGDGSTEDVVVMSQSDTSDMTDAEMEGMWKNAAATAISKKTTTKWNRMSSVMVADFAARVSPGLDLKLDDEAPLTLDAGDEELFRVILDIASISLFQSYQNLGNRLQESYLQGIVVQLLEMIALMVGAKFNVNVRIADATGKPLLYCWEKRIVKKKFKGKTDVLVYFDGCPMLMVELKPMLKYTRQLCQALLCGFSVEETVGVNTDETFQPLIALMSAGAFVVAQRVVTDDKTSPLAFSTYSPSDGQSLNSNFHMLLSLCARLCSAKTSTRGGTDDSSAFERATPCKVAPDRGPGSKSEGSGDDGHPEKKPARRGLKYSTAAANKSAAPLASGDNPKTGKQRASGGPVDDEGISREAQRAYVAKQRSHRRRVAQHSKARVVAEYEEGMRAARKVLLPR